MYICTCVCSLLIIIYFTMNVELSPPWATPITRCQSLKHGHLFRNDAQRNSDIRSVTRPSYKPSADTSMQTRNITCGCGDMTLAKMRHELHKVNHYLFPQGAFNKISFANILYKYFA